MTGPAFRRAERVLWRDLGTEILVMVPGDERVHALTGSGALVWDALRGEANAEEVARAIGGAAATPPADHGELVASFLADLEERGIAIRVRDHG